MATDMKFGPEWLRALSDGGPNSSTGTAPPPTSSAPKYKLAEYRYGREEMLALFNPHNIKPPENTDEFPHLFIDKMQLPLSLTTMTEEESRLWTRVNSDAVLRLVGKGGSGPERGERPVNERGGISMRAGRGSSVPERGRGRGRGYYQRNNFDDSGDSPPERRDFRNRAFERNHSLSDENSRERKFDRSFSRGGGGNGTAEERDLLSRKNNSRSSAVENWRTGGRGEDREGWRTARGETWNRGNSWRGGDRDKDFDEFGDEKNGPQRKYYNKDRNPNDLWDDIEENDRRNSGLPEWSLEDGSELDAKLGTFDASGAFREDTNDDEEETKSDEESADDQKDNKNELNYKNSNQMKDSPNELKIEKNKQNSDISDKKEDKMSNKGSSNPTQIQSKGQTSQKDSQSVSQSQSSQMPSNKLLNKSYNSSNFNQNTQQMKSPLEEDGFSHLEKEAENMVAQWTADDDPKDRAEAVTQSHETQISNNIVVVPVTHEDALKWFYRDPQNEIQGPFTPHEMYDWFTAGYFAMDLLVRRGCDEYFAQLGELFKLWERIPFIHVQSSTPPPLRIPSSNSSHQSLPLNSSTSHQSVHPMAATPPQHMLNPQLASHPPQPPQPIHSATAQPHQHMFANQQSVDMQSQLRLLLAQLKKQEGFSDLSQQQQQEVLVQRYVHLEQQRQQSLQTSIPNNRTAAEDSQISSLESLSNLRIQSSRPPPQQVVNKGPHVHSIWDITANSSALSVRDIEEMQRKEQEIKELEERRKAFEDEQNRKKLEQESLQRKISEERERKFEELQKKLEEERLRNQELLRKQEEEKRRREEEERMRMEDEERILNERAAEEQKRRHEELMRLEEYARLQALQEEERRRQIDVEKERQRQQLHEIERERQKEMDRMRQIQQQEAIIKLQQQQEKQRKQGPVWGQPEVTQKQHNSLSLDDIQRLQEEKDREERQKQMQQKHMQALLAAQHQQQQNKQALKWAAQTYQQSAPMKTLAEIQREEAEKVAKQRVNETKKQVTNSVPNAGIWNNATNQLFSKPIAPTKAANFSATNASAPIGFWEPESRKVSTNRANESALNSMQTNPKGNNSTQFVTKTNFRNKKEEETVMRLFDNQRRQKTDEFTQWCDEALSKYQSSVDIPTFIAFLKDVESPFEINDYVRSYLGDSKDVKEFAKQFIERRSYFRNQAKREATEVCALRHKLSMESNISVINQELMWGPAPAITPSANKVNQPSVVNSNSYSSDTDMSGFIQAGKKKKKGKRVVDNSILGFTVQADPDRINAGQIEQIDD